MKRRILASVIFSTSMSLALAGQGIHIDASSDASANRSFQRMVSSLDTHQRSELVAAVVQLNMVGVRTAADAPANPSAARIKDKIGGMTATEIIELAHHTASDVTVTTETVPVPKVVKPADRH